MIFSSSTSPLYMFSHTGLVLFQFLFIHHHDLYSFLISLETVSGLGLFYLKSMTFQSMKWQIHRLQRQMVQVFVSRLPFTPWVTLSYPLSASQLTSAKQDNTSVAAVKMKIVFVVRREDLKAPVSPTEGSAIIIKFSPPGIGFSCSELSGKSLFYLQHSLSLNI